MIFVDVDANDFSRGVLTLFHTLRLDCVKPHKLQPQSRAISLLDVSGLSDRET